MTEIIRSGVNASQVILRISNLEAVHFNNATHFVYQFFVKSKTQRRGIHENVFVTNWSEHALLTVSVYISA